MAWVIDTCLILDVLEDDAEFGAVSAELIDSKAEDGLVVAPVTYIELAPAFLGDRRSQDDFLQQMGVDLQNDWLFQDTMNAHGAWQRYMTAKRAGQATKRPIADILIGAFACRQDGLMTRNPRDFKAIFPTLDVLEPLG